MIPRSYKNQRKKFNKMKMLVISRTFLVTFVTVFLALNALVNLFTVHGNFFRRVDTNTYLVSFYA